ncbi:MAG TPA: hypothetical protein VFP26_04655 [Gemmatimonadaceae bacterium]|nr:hypothetical protein [Gemmatimonadaceae bacterium]
MAAADVQVLSRMGAQSAPIHEAATKARVSGGSGRLPARPRLLVLIASLLLIGVYVFPLWNVRLTAPQYPEGLGMHIRINTVQGATENDLDNINNLNHYIGMKRIEPSAIPELRFMPWIVAAIVVMGLLTTVVARRWLVYLWTTALLAIAAAGLFDFWRWEYDYGHNLDNEHAVLKIPGMTYQPPLIGGKQLLNFHASSWPAAGGILAGVAMVLALLAVWFTWRAQKLPLSRD